MVDLPDCHLFNAVRRKGANGAPQLVLSSCILDPNLSQSDAVAIGRGLAVRYLHHPETCDFAEDLANFEMILRARRMADGRDPAAMLWMTFVDSGVPAYGLVLVEVTGHPVYQREGGRA